MNDYYIYMDTRLIHYANSEDEAAKYVLHQINLWEMSGASGYPHYFVQYNPMGKTVRNWPARSFSDPASIKTYETKESNSTSPRPVGGRQAEKLQ